jgi:L-ascorbate metabolism protein UlaG (beta-lactamase superfamily)
MRRISRALLLAALTVLASSVTASALERGEPACRPEMAQDLDNRNWPAEAPRIIRAALKPDEVKLTFVGHSTFRIETPQGITADTDYNDYIRAPGTPVAATMNRAHSTHYSNAPDPAIRQLLPGWSSPGKPADHDVTIGDMRIRNVMTNIRAGGFGDFGGTVYDGNSIFIFEIGELCVGHLGHLHHTLEPSHLRAIGRLDVVLAPVDGGYTLDQEGMMEVLKSLHARLIIPMHFFGPSTLNRFLSTAEQHFAVERQSEPVITVTKATLPARPTVRVLPGR